jgi:lipopolysaccharide export system protein LptC
MGKLHYFTALLLIILLAVVSGWIFESIENTPLLTNEKPRHDPDYFLKNFTATTMDEKGKPAYKLKAQHLEHYPDDNSMKLEHPLFSFYENNIKSWTAKADQAFVLQDSKIIHFKGNVVLHQILSAKKNNTPMTLTADQLTIEPEKNLAHTKSNIKLTQGRNTIQAVGMRADMNKKRIEFLSRTRSHYVLPAK